MPARVARTPSGAPKPKTSRTPADHKAPKPVSPLALIRRLGPSRNSVSTPDDATLLTMGALPPERIPRLAPFVEALASMGLQHEPIPVQFTHETTTGILNVTHAECHLESEAQQALLQRLFNVRELTSYDIAVPMFGPGMGRLRRMRARTLRDALTLRGELPSLFQFLAALEAEALETLTLCFYRSQYEKPDEDREDFAYSLKLPPSAYANLRRVTLLETEEYPRHRAVPLARLLRPLLSLPYVEDVELRLPQTTLHAPDAAFVQLAHAWPHLRRLVLACPRCTADVAAPTLDAIYALADACRSLKELVLPRLDLVDLGREIVRRPPKEPLTNRPHLWHPLRSFGVACDSTTRIADAQAARVARCVDSLFPLIDTGECWRHDDSVEAVLTDWYLIWVNIVATQALRRFAPGRAYLD